MPGRNLQPELLGGADETVGVLPGGRAGPVVGERVDADCRIDSNTRAAMSSTENGALVCTYTGSNTCW